ncbi:hypothetical protein BU25DRAFT_239150 [Macroventuria anomochaeta]|uniref:Uncharacterized protein n=1 Tax=Macroventuria anomochaeta TaxID=301207 RepID=A0ACB6RI73_9PLEO|nr:uncharacterized protein BU25DRAFT_239150 [Macroventuria anomochaeta]KAF2621392.1 hypothetical protein BU25DRAFT_239150 [Macroventuria anomochaeta]
MRELLIYVFLLEERTKRVDVMLATMVGCGRSLVTRGVVTQRIGHGMFEADGAICKKSIFDTILDQHVVAISYICCNAIQRVDADMCKSSVRDQSQAFAMRVAPQ